EGERAVDEQRKQGVAATACEAAELFQVGQPVRSDQHGLGLVVAEFPQVGADRHQMLGSYGGGTVTAISPVEVAQVGADRHRRLPARTVAGTVTATSPAAESSGPRGAGSGPGTSASSAFWNRSSLSRVPAGQSQWRVSHGTGGSCGGCQTGAAPQGTTGSVSSRPAARAWAWAVAASRAKAAAVPGSGSTAQARVRPAALTRACVTPSATRTTSTVAGMANRRVSAFHQRRAAGSDAQSLSLTGVPGRPERCRASRRAMPRACRASAPTTVPAGSADLRADSAACSLADSRVVPKPTAGPQAARLTGSWGSSPASGGGTRPSSGSPSRSSIAEARSQGSAG